MSLYQRSLDVGSAFAQISLVKDSLKDERKKFKSFMRICLCEVLMSLNQRKFLFKSGELVDGRSIETSLLLSIRCSNIVLSFGGLTEGRLYWLTSARRCTVNTCSFI